MIRILSLLQAATTDVAEEGGSIFGWLGEPTLAAQTAGLLLVALVAYLSDKVAGRVLLTAIHRIVKRTAFQWDDQLLEARVFHRLAHLAPATVIYFGTLLLPSLSPGVTVLLSRVAASVIVLVALMSANALLTAINEIWASTPSGQDRPIKGYLQVVKLLLSVIGAIVIVAALIGRSPLYFLGGLGAMTAVLLIVFRDTILSFVASLQIASYDLIRVGDWIEVPQYGADGDVVDIALHTIKVQNWDKTITTVPTHRLVEGSFKNWRSMPESGGRRIKRALHIDMNTIRFLTDDDVERFEQFTLLRDYIRDKREELAADAASRAGEADVSVNKRRLTNLGTFRAYVVNYLRHHPRIHQGMTLMVRQRDPTPDGLPLEIYAFSNETAWVEYEGIQSDIFDHVLSVAPELGLRVFQHPAGRDFGAAFSGRPSAQTQRLP